MGITVCGELDEEENFDPAIIFLILREAALPHMLRLSMERKIEKEQYVGMCEDSKIGISLIFTFRTGSSI